MLHKETGQTFPFPVAKHEVGFPVPRPDVHEDEVQGRFVWIEIPAGVTPTIIYGQTKWATDPTWVTAKAGVDAGWCRFYGEDTIKDKHDMKLSWNYPDGKPNAPPLTSQGKWFAGMTFKHWSHDRRRDVRIYVEYDAP